MSNISVLVLGASYGLLVASRLAQADVLVTVVCTPEEQQDLIHNGVQVDFINNSDEIKFKLQLPVTSGQSTKVGCIGVVGCETSLDRFSMVFLAFSETQLIVDTHCTGRITGRVFNELPGTHLSKTFEWHTG
jgi:hypothetical protein